jgi:hypothetical protein
MRFKLLAVILLLCSGMMFAQTQPMPPNTSTQTNVGQPTDTNEPVYTGCVSGMHNNYFLIADDGRQFRLHSDKDIPEHVGKRVEVRGTMKKEGVDKPKNAAKTGKLQEIDVADLKDVGQSCYGGGGMAASSSTSTGSEPNTGAVAQTPGTTSGSVSGVGDTSGATDSARRSTTATTGTATTTEQSTLPQSDQPVTDVGGNKNASLFRGCLSGTKDNYMLAANDGNRYRLHSDKDIKDHVGDFVEVRGSIKSEGGQNKAVATGQGNGEIDVSDIKTIQKGCAQGQPQ